MKMSKKQQLALKTSGQGETDVDARLNAIPIDLRCVDGLKNYEKLRQMFPWLEEENGSYL
jgi:hypothetical protein